MQQTKIILIVVCLAAVGLWLGFAQRYSVVTTAEGKTVRLNRMTGETAQLEGDALVPVKTQAELEALEKQEQEKAQKASAARDLGACPLPNAPTQKATLKIKWDLMSLRYRLVLPKGVDTAGLGALNLVFKDADQFTVARAYVDLHSAAEETEEGRVLEGSVSLDSPFRKVESITSWQFARAN